ncbi:MAG: HD domain-containing protein [Bacteroidota bacterium]
MISKTEATEILHSMVDSESLRRHCLSVSMVMEAYAKKLGHDAEQWAVTGLLHDADYEKFPEQHPNIIVNQLRERGEEEIAHAISAHHTSWGVPYNSTLDKALLACDELTGFVVAASLIRPTRMDGMKVKSVTKKLKTKTFAAGVEREEVYKGAELFEVDIREHIAFIIQVLQENAMELGL